MQIIVHACSGRATASFFLNKQFNDILITCDRMITTALLLARRFVTDLSVEASEQTRSNFSLVGATIYNHFPGSCVPTSQLSSKLHDDWIKHAHCLDIPHIISWSMFLGTLIYHYVRQRCSAPGCLCTLEGLRHSFGYCKGCLCILYCSRACQKHAWSCKDGLGHQDVCALI